MEFKLPACALAALFVAGCASQPVDTSKLSYEARTMLMQAQYDVNAADAKNVNTVAAHDALDSAEAAARAGDSDAVVQRSHVADAAALLAIKKGK